MSNIPLSLCNILLSPCLIFYHLPVQYIIFSRSPVRYPPHRSRIFCCPLVKCFIILLSTILSSSSIILCLPTCSKFCYSPLLYSAFFNVLVLCFVFFFILLFRFSSFRFSSISFTCTIQCSTSKSKKRMTTIFALSKKICFHFVLLYLEANRRDNLRSILLYKPPKYGPLEHPPPHLLKKMPNTIALPASSPIVRLWEHSTFSFKEY
jgi:hypothetical protein